MKLNIVSYTNGFNLFHQFSFKNLLNLPSNRKKCEINDSQQYP